MKRLFKINELKSLIVLAIPIILAQFFSMGMGVTDIIIVGHYSDLALAAVSLGVSIWNPLMLFVAGALMCCSIVTAHRYGAKEFDKIPMVVRDGIYIVAIFMGIAMLIMCFPHPLLKLFNAKTDLIAPTVSYLRALSIGVPAIFIYFVLRYLCEGLRRPGITLRVSIVGFMINALLNYSLVYGVDVLWIPSLGVWGSGLGTGLTFWCMLGLMIGFLQSDQRLASLKLFGQIGKPDWRHIKELLRLGLPNGATVFAEVTIFAVSGLMLSRFGELVVGSHQIALNISGVAFMVPLSVSFALTAIVGQEMGRKNYEAAVRMAFMGVVLATVLMIINAIMLIGLRHLLPHAFTSNIELLKVAASLLIFSAIFQLPDGLQVAALGALRGMKDTKVPMFISIFSYWCVGIPLAWYLCVLQNWQAKGIWVAYIVALTIAAVILNIRLFQMSRHYYRLNSIG